MTSLCGTALHFYFPSACGGKAFIKIKLRLACLMLCQSGEVTKKSQALQIMVNMMETMTHKRMQQYVVIIKYVCVIFG